MKQKKQPPKPCTAAIHDNLPVSMPDNHAERVEQGIRHIENHNETAGKVLRNIQAIGGEIGIIQEQYEKGSPEPFVVGNYAPFVKYMVEYRVAELFFNLTFKVPFS